jgi:hypothetical protein
MAWLDVDVRVAGGLSRHLPITVTQRRSAHAYLSTWPFTRLGVPITIKCFATLDQLTDTYNNHNATQNT